MDNRAMAAIRATIGQCRQVHPRFRYQVEVVHEKDTLGFDGFQLVLWYPHRTGQDDHREPTQDIAPARIARLTVAEVNAFGFIAEQVASVLPGFEVVLGEVRKGTYSYFFVQKEEPSASPFARYPALRHICLQRAFFILDKKKDRGFNLGLENILFFCDAIPPLVQMSAVINSLSQ